MTTTTHLAIPLIDPGQQQQHVTHNVGVQAFEDALCESINIECVDGSNTVSVATMRGAIRLSLAAGSPAPSSAVTVVLPAVKRLIVITNASGQDADIKCDLGSLTLPVAAGDTSILYCDGAEVYAAAGASGAGASTFIGLTDVPSSYSGQALKHVRVNSGATALEFTDPPSSSSLSINAQTGTTYTLGLGDAGKLVTCDNAGAVTLTVPPNASVALPVGTQVLIAQKGAGQVTIAPGSGVTIRTPETLLLRKQFAQAAMVKIATDEWLLDGNLQAA